MIHLRPEATCDKGLNSMSISKLRNNGNQLITDADCLAMPHFSKRQTMVGPIEIIEVTSHLDAYTSKDKDSGFIFNCVHAKVSTSILHSKGRGLIKHYLNLS
ncbi:hypothetical protein DSO57_1038944 [Entomophthora muscae]|uniref:Uncharacterized protein n=1 Tax=Entomophthora muscae TaxID=34485 RepID=A0ACC2RDA1_9FUNG|nr:hypothetical protein DSO57_1038944 [Entomophthora muscae]